MTRSDVHHHFNGVLFGMFMRRFGRLCMGLFLGGGDRCLWLMLRRRVLLLLTYYGGMFFSLEDMVLYIGCMEFCRMYI